MLEEGSGSSLPLVEQRLRRGEQLDPVRRTKRLESRVAGLRGSRGVRRSEPARYRADHPVVDEIREVIAERGAAGETLIADLHVWSVGRATYSCALSVVTHDAALTPRQVREWLAVHEEIVHATIEIHRCDPH